MIDVKGQRFFSGSAMGVRGPFVLAELAWADGQSPWRSHASQTLVQTLDRLLKDAEWPLLSTVQMRTRPENPALDWLSVPCFYNGAAPLQALVRAVVAAINACDWQATQAPPLDLTALRAQCLPSLQACMPKGSNSKHFLQAAARQGIEVYPLSHKVFQYGQGARSIWLDSTFTLETSIISSNMARQKVWTHAMLAQQGLPVAPQWRVSDLEGLAKAAQALDYPLVVKPGDKDGGIGVHAHLMDWQALQAAFLSVQKISAQVLVEKFIPGRDYRISVHQGRVLWMIERQRPQIVGDGQSTVQQLIEALNAQPQRGESAGLMGLKKVAVDAALLEILAQQGVTLEQVLPLGHSVLLSYVANISAGGTPVALTEDVHPDNLALAISAVQALRLDLGGVDLILPDHRRSWKETGGVVCEVNGQPQLGILTQQHLYGQLLTGWLKGRGEIPIECIIGGRSFAQEALRAGRENIPQGEGWVDAQGIWLGGRHLAPVKNSLAGLRALLLNNRVDSVRLLVDASLVEEGLPCQAFTQLTLWQAPEQDLKQALFWLSRLAPYAQRVRADARLQQAFSIKHADFGWIQGPSGQDKES